MTGQIRVGIGGWTYEPWRGTFYPAGLPHAREIEHATRAVTAIEINSTYYSRQKPETFAKWAKAAPDGFVYAVKASRYATNRRKLAEGGESIGNFIDQGISALGDKLGPILWQFMDTKAFDRDDFASFLDLLPDAVDGRPLRHALEVRHASFETPQFVELARARGAAIVFADSEGRPSIDEDTAGFAYARFQNAQEEVASGYDDAALDAIERRVRGWAARGDVFAFMINGAKVRAPAAAQALMARLSA